MHNSTLTLRNNAHSVIGGEKNRLFLKLYLLLQCQCLDV
jgi:hypothetical protein